MCSWVETGVAPSQRSCEYTPEWNANHSTQRLARSMRFVHACFAFHVWSEGKSFVFALSIWKLPDPS